MTISGPRPERSPSQRIGSRAKKCFVANLPDDWLWTDLGGDEDFGYDFLVQVTANAEITRSFRVQLKGTTKPDRSAKGDFVSVELKTRTVRMYSDCTDPIMLVLADLSSASDPTACPLCHVWIHDELRRLNDGALTEDAQTTNLRIPTGNRLTEQTNVDEELERFGRLARIGESLDAIAEQVVPSMDQFARAELVQRIPASLARSSPSLFATLSEEVKLPWPEAPINTYAWFLNEAAVELRRGDWAAARERLDAAAGLGSDNQLELAHHAFLSGRVHSWRHKDADASAAYIRAASLSNVDKYWVAWAESEIRSRFELDKTPDFSDVLSRLTLNSPAILGIRARLLAAEKRFDEALQLSETIPGFEGHVARAIVLTMSGNPNAAEKAATAGLAEPDLKESTRLVLFVLRARALFQQAVGQHVEGGADEIIPPSGPVGTDIQTLRRAWCDITAAVKLMRLTGWSPNIELLSDIWVASASILGKLQDVLPLMIEASRSQPELPTIQEALETAATHLSNFEIALEANARQPDSEGAVLRRTLLLNLAGRHSDCVMLFESRGQSCAISYHMFFPALVAAIRSAEAIVRSDLVQEWDTRFLQQEPLARIHELSFYWGNLKEEGIELAGSRDAPA